MPFTINPERGVASTEQNRTVSLLISGHIHDIEIQCEQQNVIYKGLGICFSSKYKAVIQIGTSGCSHSLVSVVLIVERGGGGGIAKRLLKNGLALNGNTCML